MKLRSGGILAALMALTAVLNSTAFGQAIRVEGSYVSDLAGYNSSGQDFLCFKQNRFWMFRKLDIDDQFGKGNFIVRGDSLILFFENIPVPGLVEKQPSKRDAGDSIVLNVTVKDGDGSPLPSAGIQLASSATGQTVGGNGVGRIAVPKSKGVKDTLAVSFVGHRTAYIPIDLTDENNQSFIVRLVQYTLFDRTDVIGYPAERWKGSFSLSISHTKVPFKKISAGKFKKAITKFAKKHRLPLDVLLE